MRILNTLHDHVQTPTGGGPISRMWQAIQQLGWKWPSTGILRDDWGTPLHWLHMPQGLFLHMLRASQRRNFLRKIPKTRHDLGTLPDVPQGVDMYACTWTYRTKGKARCTQWEKGLLCNYLCGGDHTQQRMSRAKLSSDPSPLCRWCNLAEGTQEHTVWRCPLLGPAARSARPHDQ